jgi:hypothetical protein
MGPNPGRVNLFCPMHRHVVLHYTLCIFRKISYCTSLYYPIASGTGVDAHLTISFARHDGTTDCSKLKITILG